MKDFINEFERRKCRIESYKMILPTGVLAYRLLQSANISEHHQQLARATIGDLNYENMLSQLKKIFGDSSTLNDSDLTNINDSLT